jgi:hypothetical protein
LRLSHSVRSPNDLAFFDQDLLGRADGVLFNSSAISLCTAAIDNCNRAFFNSGSTSSSHL